MNGKVTMWLNVVGGAPKSVQPLTDRVLLTPLLLADSASPERRALRDAQPVMDVPGIAITPA